MRISDHYYVVVLQDPDATLSPAADGVVLARQIYREWNGKVGECVQSTFRNGAYWFLLRFEDRFECFDHRQVRLAPNEMQEMEEDLRKLIEFNRKHETNEPGSR